VNGLGYRRTILINIRCCALFIFSAWYISVMLSVYAFHFQHNLISWGMTPKEVTELKGTEFTRIFVYDIRIAAIVLIVTVVRDCSLFPMPSTSTCSMPVDQKLLSNCPSINIWAVFSILYQQWNLCVFIYTYVGSLTTLSVTRTI
jgi:hypothetical protein